MSFNFGNQFIDSNNYSFFDSGFGSKTNSTPLSSFDLSLGSSSKKDKDKSWNFLDSLDKFFTRPTVQLITGALSWLMS